MIDVRVVVGPRYACNCGRRRRMGRVRSRVRRLRLSRGRSDDRRCAGRPVAPAALNQGGGHAPANKPLNGRCVPIQALPVAHD